MEIFLACLRGTMTEKNNSTLLWGWQIGTYFMSALSINNRDLYDRIGNREITPSEFTEFLKPLTLFHESSIADGHWWAALLYIGAFGDQKDKLEPEFRKLGVWDPSNKEEGAFQKELSSFGRAFSRFSRDDPVFSKIYQTLEGLKTFASE